LDDYRLFTEILTPIKGGLGAYIEHVALRAEGRNEL
jgi:hypothetical protein